ncbi:MAG: GNAT family N-acetyltransferase [Bacteroidota bacterium]
MHPLDNPIWHALQSVDKNKNQGDEESLFFFPEISPFVGLKDWDSSSLQKLFDILPAGRTLSTLIANPFVLNDQWELIFSLTLFQMVCTQQKTFKSSDLPLEPLSDEHIPQMIDLTALTKPGPFVQRTIDFGNYFGVFENDQLVAMAGERLHLADYTEVSAVCTHPAYLGKGYAVALVHYLTEQILATGKTAFLHVRQDNERAIQLYQGLGYEIRTEMYFAVIKPKK